MAKLWDSIGQKLGDLLDDLTTPDVLREELSRGVAALEAGEPARAEASFRHVTLEEGENGRAWQLLGMSLLAQERHSEAISALEMAAALRSSDHDLRVTLMEAYRLGQDLEAALLWAKEALGTAGSDQEMRRVYSALGEIHLERRAWDHAVRELRKAQALTEGADLELSGLLGRALYRGGGPNLARHHLTMAATATPPMREVLLLLGKLDLEQGRPHEAGQAALRLLEQDSKDMEARLMGLRSMLRKGELEQARQGTLALMESAPNRPEVHQLLGEIYAAGRDLSGAVLHMHRAIELELEPDLQVELLEQVLDLELELEEAPGIARDADLLLALRPQSPLALSAQALSLADTAPDKARSCLDAALTSSESSAPHMVQGIILLEEGRAEEAAFRLEAALRLDSGSARARRTLRRAQQARSGLSVDGGGDLYPRLPALARLLEAHPALAKHAPEVTHVREVFDRPLLICVMGEFNSGKSTLVNALIGEEVAAMGVTPTTATINLLKYGERRSARVIWQDDHEELLAWSEVHEFLNSLDAARAAEVRQVELLYPSEELLQVNVVDTPGLNSLVEGHERTAREVLARADAVIWLFSAQQAGKQTEKEALDLLRQHRLKTVGVLNKIDRLTGEELDQVMEHLNRGFSELVDRLLPVSTRQALRGMVEDDSELLQRSRFPELRDHLEQAFFSRSMEVKRQATSRRLEQSLGAALQTIESRLNGLDQAEQAVLEFSGWLEETFIPARLEDERSSLEGAQAEVYRRGAAEVLEFVQPRRWALGEHHAAPADRDFLLSMFIDGLQGMCDASLARMAKGLKELSRALRRGLQPLEAAGEPERFAPHRAALDQLLGDRLVLLREQVYTRYTAFARGCLEGGRVDSFLTGKLPRLKLEEQVVHDALWNERVDLEAELLTPLYSWQDELKAALQDHLTQLKLELELCRVELTCRFLDPLAEMLRLLN